MRCRLEPLCAGTMMIDSYKCFARAREVRMQDARACARRAREKARARCARACVVRAKCSVLDNPQPYIFATTAECEIGHFAFRKCEIGYLRNSAGAKTRAPPHFPGKDVRSRTLHCTSQPRDTTALRHRLWGVRHWRRNHQVKN